MDLSQLRVFYHVAKFKSFAAAADALFVTPPAVSIKIKQLEGHYDLKLFERSGRKVELTDPGEALLGYAERVFNLVKEADDHMDDLKGGMTGNLKISTGLTVGTYHLAPLINVFSKQFPGVDIHMKVKNKKGVIDDILMLNDDLGFIGNVPVNPSLVVTPLWKEELVVITSKSRSFGQKPSILPAELSHQPLIVREKGSGTREYIEERLRRQGIATKTVMEIGSDEAIKRAVAVGLGMSIVPIGVVEKEVKRGIIKQYRVKTESLYLVIFYGSPQRQIHLQSDQSLHGHDPQTLQKPAVCKNARLLRTGSGSRESKAMTMRLLFVGNSHTYLNYMPQMVKRLIEASAPRTPVEVDQSVSDSVSLEWHWDNARTRELIVGGGWDFVVLQDSSRGPLNNRVSFERHARLLDAEIRGGGARTVLYMTWAHRLHPQTQADIADAYTSVAEETDALLAPAGLAWQRALHLDPALELHHADGRHASAAGSYLSACVLYAVLTGASPVGLPAGFMIEGKQRPELPPETANLLQRVAAEVALGSAGCGRLGGGP